jgi:hypothetical protein
VRRYFQRRIDRPHLWVIVLGVLGASGGAIAGVRHQIPDGPLVGGCMIGTVCAMAGLVIGSGVWLVCRLAGGLDKPVCRPDIWAFALRCPECGWRTTPEGPWSRRDCLSAPVSCPACSRSLVGSIPDCPRCKHKTVSAESTYRDILAVALLHWRDRRQFLYGRIDCKRCGCPFDRWGREIVITRRPHSKRLLKSARRG